MVTTIVLMWWKPNMNYWRLYSSILGLWFIFWAAIDVAYPELHPYTAISLVSNTLFAVAMVLVSLTPVAEDGDLELPWPIAIVLAVCLIVAGLASVIEDSLRECYVSAAVGAVFVGLFSYILGGVYDAYKKLA